MNPCSSHYCTRRMFLKTGTVAAGLALNGSSAFKAPADSFVDVNVNLSRWPLRRLPGDTTGQLAEKLRSRGVTQAWAGTFDGLLHKDLSAANSLLAGECRRFTDGLLLPFGSINPGMYGWADELRRCAREHGMRGIRLHPNYHGYTLNDPVFEQLLHLAVELDLIVQVALAMEDERPMHRLLRVAPVDVALLAAIVERVPGLRMVLLNAMRSVRTEMLTGLLEAGEVYVDLAMLEGVGGLDRLLSCVSVERVLFGSNAPLFYFEAAELKLREAFLDEKQLRAVRFANASTLLEPRR